MGRTTTLTGIANMAEPLQQRDRLRMLSISRLAELLQMDRKTVARRIADANLAPTGKRDGYPVYDGRQAIDACLSRSESAGATDPDRLRPFERKAWFASELARLEFETVSGNLLPVERVHVLLADIYGPMIRALDSLGDRIERDLRVSPTVVEYIRDEVGKARDQMEAGLHALLGK